MSPITIDSLFIDKVSKKLFFIHNAPAKPMVSASCFQDPSYNNGSYFYQIDIAVYLPSGITNLRLQPWKDQDNNQVPISNCLAKQLPNMIDSCHRQITIGFDGIEQFDSGTKLGKLPSLLKQDTVELDLYIIQLRYHTTKQDTAESIFVNYVYDDPETTRGTVTTVRDIDETKI